jgi:thioredoxin-dependent peroxiredoxin
MAIQLAQIAPDFEQDSTIGRLRFHAWLGESWGVLFSHPRDFTPVCTTELAEVARLKPEWEKRNVQPTGLSVDPTDSHKGWELDIEETQGQVIDFPVIADADRKVSDLYGMVHRRRIRRSPSGAFSSLIRPRRSG